MNRILFLFLSVLCITNNVHSLSTMPKNQVDKMDKLVKLFTGTSYKYSVLSMTLYHSDVALVGMSELVKKLSEEKIKFANLCLDYISSRNPATTFPHSLTVNKDNWNILDYTMNAKFALDFLLHHERHLFQKIEEILGNMDTHGKHFLTHTIMEAQYDRLSRIKSLHSQIKKDDKNSVYNFQFDRSVKFLFDNSYIAPVGLSIGL